MLCLLLVHESTLPDCSSLISKDLLADTKKRISNKDSEPLTYCIVIAIHKLSNAGEVAL